MTNDFTLHQTPASGLLVPTKLAQALAQLALLPGAPRVPSTTIRGQALQFALTLSLDDAACAGFVLDFVGQGLRVRGTAHGPSAALLRWAFHAIADATKCVLHDNDDEADIVAEPEAHREDALTYLFNYETEVVAGRRSRDDSGASFLRWLAREEYLVLADNVNVDELGASLEMNDAPTLFEKLLDTDEVEDVFVSESEFASLLTRFRARSSRG